MTLNDKANKPQTKKKVNWLRIWQIIRDIIVTLLASDKITEIIN